MASLQAGHTRSCAGGKRWTAFANLGECDCQPTYYVVVRDGTRNHSERIGENRKTAERALRKVDVQIDEGNYEPVENIRFRDWGVARVARAEGNDGRLVRLVDRVRDGGVRRRVRPPAATRGPCETQQADARADAV
jgi:hypothetical protein